VRDAGTQKSRKAEKQKSRKAAGETGSVFSTGTI
jgi:hypothetical protein